MTINDKKMAVLQALRQKTEASSLRELLHDLGEEYTERSLRRWLAEMIEEGSVERLGKKRSAKYQSVAIANQYQIEEGALRCFGVESAKIIAQVRRPFHQRLPTAYNDAWFEAYLPNSTFYFPPHIRAQLLKAGRRSKHGDPAGTYAHQIFDRLLIDLSYNSSRLEGNTYSLLDTQRLILEGADAEGKLDAEKIMILNHKEAIRFLVDNASRLQVSTQAVCTLHYLLSDGLIESQYAGKIRGHGVRVGGSGYVPSENPKWLEFQLKQIVKKAALIKDPYEQSLFLLVHISYLQAFADVNKRTARLCSNIPLVKNNLVPLSFNDVEKEDYTSAVIAIYELQGVKPMVDLYVFSYMRTCAMYDSTIKAIGFDEIRVRYRQQRRALIRDVILRCLTGEKLKKHVNLQAAKLIPKKDRSSFVEDVWEDFKEMDQSRIAGLGITLDQLNAWLSRI